MAYAYVPFRDLAPLIRWSLPSVAALAALISLKAQPSIDSAPHLEGVHVVVSVLAALLGIAAAVLIGRVAHELQEARLLVLTLALIAIAGIATEHGLASEDPDVLFKTEGIVSFPALLELATLSSGAIFFALSALSWPRRSWRWLGRRTGLFIFLGVLGQVALNAAALSVPATSTEGLVVNYTLVVWLVTIPTVGLYFWAAYRYGTEYSLTRLPMQGALFSGLLLFGVTQLDFAVSSEETWSYIEGQITLIVAFAIILVGIVYEYRRGRPLARVMQGVLRLEGLVQTELEYSDIIASLAAATEARDPHTRGHCVRVADIAVRLGEYFRLPPGRLRILARSGLLHDIGKLGIPDSILLKPGPLTDEEFGVMRRHPELGLQILNPNGSLDRECELIRLHHERVDGKGYPRGVNGADIPLEGRILSVADVYDSLVTDRPYRAGYTPERALQILRDEAGTHLDAEVVDAWVHLVSLPEPDGVGQTASQSAL